MSRARASYSLLVVADSSPSVWVFEVAQHSRMGIWRADVRSRVQDVNNTGNNDEADMDREVGGRGSSYHDHPRKSTRTLVTQPSHWRHRAHEALERDGDTRREKTLSFVSYTTTG